MLARSRFRTRARGPGAGSGSGGGGSLTPLARILALDPTALWWPSEATMTVARDGTGAAPVAGEPVGRMLDLTPNAVNAIAPTDAARPLLGRVPVTGRRNLLTYTEQFENAAWTKLATTVSVDQATAPDGTTTADTWTLNAGVGVTVNALGLFTSGGSVYLRTNAFTLLAAPYTASIYVKFGSGLDHVQLRAGTNVNLAGTSNNVTVRLSDGVVIATDGTTVVTNAGNGWWRIQHTWTATAATWYIGLWAWNSTSIASTAGTENYSIWGAQLETGSTATAYQRVVTALDVTEAGVADREYVDFDAVDDQLAGALVDGTYYLATVATNGTVSYTSTVLSGGTGLVINTDLSALIVRGTDYSAGEKSTIEGVFA